MLHFPTYEAYEHWRRKRLKYRLGGHGLTPAQLIMWTNIPPSCVTPTEYVALNTFIADIEAHGDWQLLHRLRFHWLADELCSLTCVISGAVMTKGTGVVKDPEGWALDGTADGWLNSLYSNQDIRDAAGEPLNSLTGAYITDTTFPVTFENNHLWSSDDGFDTYNYLNDNGAVVRGESRYTFAGGTFFVTPIDYQNTLQVSLRQEADPVTSEWWVNTTRVDSQTWGEGIVSSLDTMYGNRVATDAEWGLETSFGMTFQGFGHTLDDSYSYDPIYFHAAVERLRTDLGL